MNWTAHAPTGLFVVKGKLWQKKKRLSGRERFKFVILVKEDAIFGALNSAKLQPSISILTSSLLQKFANSIQSFSRKLPNFFHFDKFSYLCWKDQQLPKQLPHGWPSKIKIAGGNLRSKFNFGAHFGDFNLLLISHSLFMNNGPRGNDFFPLWQTSCVISVWHLAQSSRVKFAISQDIASQYCNIVPQHCKVAFDKNELVWE